jgi:hypothetical protein
MYSLMNMGENMEMRSLYLHWKWRLHSPSNHRQTSSRLHKIMSNNTIICCRLTIIYVPIMKDSHYWFSLMSHIITPHVTPGLHGVYLRTTCSEQYSAYSKSYTKPTFNTHTHTHTHIYIYIFFKVKTYDLPQPVCFKLLSKELTHSRTRGDKRNCISEVTFSTVNQKYSRCRLCHKMD